MNRPLKLAGRNPISDALNNLQRQIDSLKPARSSGSRLQQTTRGTFRSSTPGTTTIRSSGETPVYL